MSRGHGKGSAACEAIFARLSEYLDEELDPTLCSELDTHMEGCAPCRAFLESLRRTVDALQAVESPRLPDELRREVLATYHNLKDGLQGGPSD
jgi:anti-sigma factor RsiW